MRQQIRISDRVYNVGAIETVDEAPGITAKTQLTHDIISNLCSHQTTDKVDAKQSQSSANRRANREIQPLKQADLQTPEALNDPPPLLWRYYSW